MRVMQLQNPTPETNPKDHETAMNEHYVGGRQDIVKLAQEIQSLRNHSVFLFLDEIYPQQWLKVRQELVHFRKKHKEVDKVDIILESPGGSPDEAYKIIRAFRNNFKTVNIVVPLWAKSAATLLSLGASEIIMDEEAEFGPIDVQVPKQKDDSPYVGYESALNDEVSLRLIEDNSLSMYQKMFVANYMNEYISVNKEELSSQLLHYVSSFYKPLLEQIDPYKLGEKKRKSEITVKYAKRLLMVYQNKSYAETEKFVDYIVNECPSHRYVIDYRMMNVFMDNVKTSSEVGSGFASKLTEMALLLAASSEKLDIIGFLPEHDGADAFETKSHGDLSGSVTTVQTPESEKTNGQAEHVENDGQGQERKPAKPQD
jgi:hypothetical protein